MTFALLMKTWRDARLLLGIILFVSLGFEMLLVFAMRQFAGDLLTFFSGRPFIMKIFGTLMGANLAADVSSTGLMTLGFVHPIFFAMTWSYILGTCTRVTVGEIDRGTADLLLALPCSRTRLYATLSALCLLTLVPLSFVPWAGIWLGNLAFPFKQPLDFTHLAYPLPNLLALNIAIASFTFMISGLSSRRGPAVAVVLGVLLASYLLNFLVALVPELEWLAPLGLLDYYKPLESVRKAHFAIASIGCLLGGAAVFWSAGLWWFHRRDIPAV